MDGIKVPVGLFKAAKAAVRVARGARLWLRDYMVAVDVGPELCSRVARNHEV